jgi:hypothetical protein
MVEGEAAMAEIVVGMIEREPAAEVFDLGCALRPQRGQPQSDMF